MVISLPATGYQLPLLFEEPLHFPAAATYLASPKTQQMKFFEHIRVPNEGYFELFNCLCVLYICVCMRIICVRASNHSI